MKCVTSNLPELNEYSIAGEPASLLALGQERGAHVG